MKHRNEIIIAFIGLLGVIFTALLSNYDKLFDSSPSQAQASPYENVDDINLQIRYFVEISGVRKSLEEMEKVTAEKYKAKYGATDEEINCVLDNRIKTEQLIELFVASTKNHVTLKQMKDLNRVYSSESMRSYNEASPLIVRDLLAGLDKLYERMQIRNLAVIRAAKKQPGETCPST